MFELSPILIAVVPAIVALVQVAKNMGLDSRYAPLISLVLGVGASFLLSDGTYAILVVQGVVLGLTASGIYSGSKASFTS